VSPRAKLPILTTKHTKEDKKLSWDYDGRTWNFYSHLLASNYGWTLEYIGKLGIDEVIAKIQEILTEEQLNKEFQWSMSEIAYPYNKSTKKSEFKPLKRPYWMLAEVTEIKKIKILKSLLPIGNVQDVSGMEKLLAEREAQGAQINSR
jgi:hypothetical protein